jgi:hypothetical protein
MMWTTDQISEESRTRRSSASVHNSSSEMPGKAVYLADTRRTERWGSKGRRLRRTPEYKKVRDAGMNMSWMIAVLEATLFVVAASLTAAVTADAISRRGLGPGGAETGTSRSKPPTDRRGGRPCSGLARSRGTGVGGLHHCLCPRGRGRRCAARRGIKPTTPLTRGADTAGCQLSPSWSGVGSEKLTNSRSSIHPTCRAPGTASEAPVWVNFSFSTGSSAVQSPVHQRRYTFGRAFGPRSRRKTECRAHRGNPGCADMPCRTASIPVPAQG